MCIYFNLQEGKYAIVTDRWQKFSDVYLDDEILDFLANYADEFLVHGVDVEGKKYVLWCHVYFITTTTDTCVWLSPTGLMP